MKKFLFICSANKQRSKTAEDYFAKGHPNYHFKSAGTNIKICRKEGTTELTEELLIWADTIFVMEQKHVDIIKRNTSGSYFSKIEILNIPDIYEYYSKELIEILEEKVCF